MIDSIAGSVTLAQAAAAEGGGSWFYPALLFAAVTVMLFIVFRYMLFRFLIRYFSPRMARRLTVCLFFLYAVTWLIFGSYILFACLVGLWKWVLVFLVGLWFIWFLVVVLTRDETVYSE